LQARIDRATEESARVNGTLRSLGERLASLTDELHARGAKTESSSGAEVEAAVLLKRIASAVEAQSNGFDDSMRAHLRSLDLTLGQLVEEGSRGRDHAVAELRNEIRLLARTLSVIADRER
jgi:hypothetical protein